MEWVETTGKTVHEAKEQALDQLGVDDADAQFEVIEEPRPGLFGRIRGEARIRARVAPKAQRPKQERRGRKVGRPSTDGDADGHHDGQPVDGRSSAASAGASAAATRPASARRTRSRSSSARQKTGSAAAPAGGRGNQHDQPKGTDMDEVVTVGGQADIMQEFLDGLLGAFSLEGDVNRVEVDDETLELAMEGADLGLLIGPKGQTLAAIQDLARTYLQRTATGEYQGRVRIDVGGYRQRRREALERFVADVAVAVRDSGVQRALEPMGPADRKVVHDAVNGIDGVRTLSEGQDPRRRVVVIPIGD